MEGPKTCEHLIEFDRDCVECDAQWIKSSIKGLMRTLDDYRGVMEVHPGISDYPEAVIGIIDAIQELYESMGSLINKEKED